MSSVQATVIRGFFSNHAMYSTKRVLPQPVGPLSITGIRTWYAAWYISTSSETAR